MLRDKIEEKMGKKSNKGGFPLIEARSKNMVTRKGGRNYRSPRITWNDSVAVALSHTG